MSDYDFLSRIHPDDLKPVRLCMEYVYRLYKEPDYDHVNIRYRLNTRYRKGDGEYAHIYYEAVTLTFEEQFVDVALIDNCSHDKPFNYVELIVEKNIRKRFVKIAHFVPSLNNMVMTRREREIASLIQEGCSNNHIAERLSISEFTVKNHKRNLFRKLNVKNSLQLITLMNRTPENEIVTTEDNR